uniref:SH3 domain-containing protein n=1 Tax=Strigamia maritima TaxID=126957 RepID=T1J3V5_STRMM
MVEARVEYDYDAENADELTLRTGEVITHVVQKEGGWWEGKLNGKHGVFPDNFVKVLNIKEKGSTSDGKANGIPLRKDKKRKCRVIYSYTPVNEDELELDVDNTIEVLEEVEEGWWKGVLNGRVGVFPSNFVEEMNERTASVPPCKTNKDGADEIKPKPIRGVGLGNIFQDEIIRLKPTQDSPPDRK